MTELSTPLAPVAAQKLTDAQALAAYRERARAATPVDRPRLRVCMTGCRAVGAEAVCEALRAELDKAGMAGEVDLVETGCHGFCIGGPIVAVDPAGLSYQHVLPADAADIVNLTLRRGETVERLTYLDPNGQRFPLADDLPFYRRQMPVVLRNCGRIDPGRIDHYIARDGYAALAQVLTGLTPEQVIEQVRASGLRGRGGAGFSTGQKWHFARLAPGDLKYVICNGDEGDPGAFMDRGVLEGDPHSVIEGLLIAAYAIGARRGYVYVRAEYPIAVRHLGIALQQAEELGLLGDDILGSGFHCRIELREGAGAFVCGEETALIASIEGRRGLPRPRPPFPAQAGLWGKPTNINNVETYANIAPIVLRGADWFAGMGTERSKGTKVFALAGQVANTGLVEVPMGLTLRDIVFDVGGGVPGGGRFKAVQMGGPSGGCVPIQHLDTPIDYDSLTSLGAIMGSGGMIVMDETTCIVDIARFFLDFCQNESCGKCIPCRVGTKRMLEILVRICEGQGEESDIETLRAMALAIKDSSLCGLGQTAPNPVLSTLRYFREEYEAHIVERRCPAGVCRALIRYVIDAEKCTGCGACRRACPYRAIQGEKKLAHVIDEALCVKCGICRDVCKFDAVVIR